MSQFQVRYEHFKREDTTNSMVINLYDDNGAPITPSGSHTWTAKVATDDGYAGEFPVVLSGNDIVLRSSQMTRLPHGQYVLEIWENNNGAVTIYPNAGFIPFEIHKNAPDAIGIVEPTKDINKIIDDLHKAGQNIKLGTVTTGTPGSSVIIRQRLENSQNLLDFTIPRGDKGGKGDKGDQGPAPNLAIGKVTTVGAGTQAGATINGGNGNYTLNLSIPQGLPGAGINLNWTVADLTDAKYDQNKWYPVVNTDQIGDMMATLAVKHRLNGEKPSYAQHNNGFTVDAQYRFNDPQYRSIIPVAYIDAEVCYYVNQNKNPVHFDVHANNGGNVLYLRGGASYKIGSSWTKGSWMIKDDGYSMNEIDFPVTSEEPVSFAKLYKKWGASAHVVNLQTLTEMGGINSPNLFSGNMPTLFYKPQSGTAINSAERMKAQWFDAIPDNMEVLPKVDQLLDVKKGDKISQSLIVRTDGKLESVNLTFWAKVQFTHHIVPAIIERLGDNLYRVSGSYTFTQDDQLRMMDLHMIKITGATYVSLTAPRVWLDSVGGGNSN